MEKFELRFDDDLDLTIARQIAGVVIDDIQIFLGSRIKSRLTKNIIWDIKGGGMGQLTLDELKDFMASRQTSKDGRLEDRHGGHTIFVTPGDAERVLMKWYKSYLELHHDSPVTVHVCTSMDEALGLLRDLKDTRDSSP